MAVAPAPGAPTNLEPPQPQPPPPGSYQDLSLALLQLRLGPGGAPSPRASMRGPESSSAATCAALDSRFSFTGVSIGGLVLGQRLRTSPRVSMMPRHGSSQPQSVEAAAPPSAHPDASAVLSTVGPGHDLDGLPGPCEEGSPELGLMARATLPSAGSQAQLSAPPALALRAQQVAAQQAGMHWRPPAQSSLPSSDHGYASHASLPAQPLAPQSARTTGDGQGRAPSPGPYPLASVTAVPHGGPGSMPTDRASRTLLSLFLH